MISNLVSEFNFGIGIDYKNLQYFRQIQTEIAYVTKHRDELLAAMDDSKRQERLDLCRKLEEKVRHIPWIEATI